MHFQIKFFISFSAVFIMAQNNQDLLKVPIPGGLAPLTPPTISNAQPTGSATGYFII